MGIKFDTSKFNALLTKTVEDVVSKMLTDQLEGDLRERVVNSGVVAQIDMNGKITLSGGDPEINAEAMAIWTAKSA